MSVGSLPKCCGFIILSVSAISLSVVKSAGDCVRNANYPTTPFRNGEESGKVIRNPYLEPDHHQKLISSSDW